MIKNLNGGNEQQKAFEEIKEYMKSPPVLIPPQKNKPFELYISADDQTIGSALMQEFDPIGNTHVAGTNGTNP